MTWAVGDWVLDPKDGEVVEVLGTMGAATMPGDLYPVLIIVAGRDAVRGALAGERTLRRLDDPYWTWVERGAKGGAL